MLKKELIESSTSFRFWIGFAASLAIAGGVAWAAGEDYALRRDRLEALSRGYGMELEDAHTYSEAQPTVVRPPEPFSLFDPGFDARLGSVVRIVPFRIPFEAKGPSHGNEWLSSAPEIGLTAVVGLVLGFFALLLTFDAFVRERENGSLRLLGTHGATPAKLLLAKYLAALLAVSLPLLAAVAFATERLCALAGPVTGEAWQRLGLLALACLGYLSCAILWGLALSVRAVSRPGALTRAMAAWLVALVIVPVVAGNSANDLLRRQRRSWALEERIARLEKERDEAIRRALPPALPFDGHTPISETGNSETGTIRRRFGSAPAYDPLSRSHAIEAPIVAAYARQIAAVEHRRDAASLDGERLFRALSAASPGALLDRLSRALAGTSFADHQRFLAASRHYHGEVQGYFARIGAFGSWRWHTDDLPGRLHPWPLFLRLRPEDVTPGNARRIAGGLGEIPVSRAMKRLGEEYDTDGSRRVDLRRLPGFAPPAPALADRLREAGPEALALLLFHLGALAYAWPGLRRGLSP